MLRPTGQSKRAHRTGALFAFWLLCLLLAPAHADSCLPFRADEWVRSVYVYDGDTIKLEDGRKVRLLGINTPEISHHGKPSEPFGKEARQALVKLLAGNPRLALRYEEDRKDRYGRLLAHVYLPDKRDVELVLLRQGLAAAVAIAPNVGNFDCYLAAEREAQGKGMWKLSYYQGVETTALPRGTRGFRLLRGKVVHFGESRRSYWLDLAGHVAGRIPKRDMPSFEGRLDLRKLEGKRIRVRGWLYQVHGETRLNLYHPDAIELLN
jgi:micrococcal nuclease